MVPSHFHLPKAQGIFLCYLLWQPGFVPGGKSHNILGIPRQMVLLAGPRPKGAVPECTRDVAVFGSEAETTIGT